MNSKIGPKEAKKIWDNFSCYASFSDLRSLYNKVVPEIQKFESKLLEISKDQVKLEQIVTRFDEVLSEKVSKLNLHEVKEKLKTYTLKSNL